MLYQNMAMSSKSKGSDAERSLIHLFWQAGWAAMRAAGSGSTGFPSPDIIAGRDGRLLAIECKKTIKGKKYIERREVAELLTFANILKAEPWLAVKFPKKEWLFVSAHDAEERKKSVMVGPEMIELRGLSFEEVISRP